MVLQAVSWQGNNPVLEEISVCINLFPALPSFCLSVVLIYPIGLLFLLTVPLAGTTAYYPCGLCEVCSMQVFEV